MLSPDETPLLPDLSLGHQKKGMKNSYSGGIVNCLEVLAWRRKAIRRAVVRQGIDYWRRDGRLPIHVRVNRSWWLLR